MTSSVLVIKFPSTREDPKTKKRIQNEEHVQWTGVMAYYKDLKLGQLFLVSDRVYEKLSEQEAGILLPWLQQLCDFKPDTRVGVLEIVKHSHKNERNNTRLQIRT